MVVTATTLAVFAASSLSQVLPDIELTFLQLIRFRQFLLFQLRFLLIRSSCRPIKVLYLRFCMSSNTAFRKLLKSESSAALPATEDAVVELFDLYVVRRRPARREAVAIQNQPLSASNWLQFSGSTRM